MAYEQFANAYDRLMADMPYPEWIRWTKDRCRQYGVEPETIVELGCGTGEISLRLAREGYQVYGIDLSEDMLAIAQSKAEQQKSTGGGSVTWIHGDMRNWSLPQQAELIVSYCDCFNYLLEMDQIEASFRRAYEGLAPGGLFLFDMLSASVYEAYAALQPFILNEDDISYIWTCELNDDRSEIQHDLSIFMQQANGDYRKIEESHVQRAYDISELRACLEAVGFADVNLTADFAEDAPVRESERIFFAARKPELA